jgi:hypothetical protein
MSRLIREQSENSSYEELVRETAFSLMIERGLKDSGLGKAISNQENGMAHLDDAKISYA